MICINISRQLIYPVNRLIWKQLEAEIYYNKKHLLNNIRVPKNERTVKIIDQSTGSPILCSNDDTKNTSNHKAQLDKLFPANDFMVQQEEFQQQNERITLKISTIITGITPTMFFSVGVIGKKG